MLPVLFQFVFSMHPVSKLVQVMAGELGIRTGIVVERLARAIDHVGFLLLARILESVIKLAQRDVLQLDSVAFRFLYVRKDFI